MNVKSMLKAVLGVASLVGTVCADVPDSFVEYVESTNSTTYVDTGIDPSPKLTRMVVTLSPTVVNTTQYAVFGRGNSWGNANSSYILLNGANFRMDWIGGQTTGPAARVGEIYTFDCCNNEATVNGTRYSTTTGKTEAYAGQPIYIFNENNNGSKLTGARMRLYACNIWRDGTTLSARYIPCVKDGVGGLYNTVDGTILYDASGKMPLAASANAHADYRVSAGVAQVRITCTKPSTGGTSDAPAEQWAEIGSTLALTATPDSGYKTVWCVTDEDGKLTTMFTGDTFDYAVTGSKDSISLSFAPASAVATADELYAAIEAAEEGDTINMTAGEFVLTKTLTLDKNVKIVGAGADQTTIIAPTMAKFLSIDINHADAVLEGIALTGIYFTSKPSGDADDGCYLAGVWKSPICVKVQKGTLRDSVIRDNYATLQYGTGPWLYMTGGRAENVKILDNYYNRTGNSVTGYAVYMKGNAVMENCEIARNGCPWEENGCIWMEGTAKMLHCDVHDNDGKAGNYHGGIYMNASGVLVEGCRIYGNNNGVYLGNGTLRNSLIYANRTKMVTSDATCYYAGVRMNNGTMQNCTIYGNVSPGDASGVAGLHMTNGTAENNIIYGNGGVRVTGGTFNNNLTDADAGRGTGNIIGDPAFIDAANGDFRLGVGSLAIGAGKTIAAVTNDFAGVARPQGAAYDIGAYERPAATELACGVAVGQVNWKEGSAPTVTAAVEGTEDEPTYQWFVDGVEIEDTSATPSLGELAVGRHTVKLVVTAGGSSAESTRTDAVCVQPLTNYVSATGSDTFPYDTEDKAARSVEDALAAVYGGADATGTVNILAGTYYLDSTLVVGKPVTIVGAGRDETFVSGGKLDDRTRGMNIAHAAATVKELSFVGCTNMIRGAGVYMSAGMLDNVRVARHYHKRNGNDERWGAGIYLTGGTVTNSVIEYNYLDGNYHGTRGGGIYMTGGLVTDCDICHNWMARTQHNGLGVWTSGGTVRNCRIFDNYSTSNGSGGSGAENASSGHGVNMSSSAIVENCLIFSNGWNGVMVRGGTLRNCAVFGHRKCTADYFAGVNISGGSVVNCTIADNYAAADSNGKSGLWQTGGTVVNTIIYNNGLASLGSCQVSGGTFKTNITDKVESEGGFVQDPKFVDSTGDFHLLTGSPAIDKAAPLVAYDLEGTARPQREGWDIGCYEMPPSTEKSVTIASDVVEGPSGMEIVAEAKLENISGNITYKWALKDASGAVVASDEGGEGHETFTRKIDAAGAYSLALEVVADEVTYAAKETQAFTVRPCEVYVSQAGSDTYPYDVPEKATTNVNAALTVLWQSANATSVLHVAEGTYYLTDQLMLSTPVKVLGAGRDVSVLNGSRIPETTRGITMSHDDAVVRDLTLDGCTNQVVATGSGIRLEKGWIENVHITRIQQKNTGGHQSAVGLYMNGGTATNVVIDNCSCPSSYGNTQGIGAMVGGGLLVDSEVRDIKLNRGELHGIGVNVTGGTVRRVKITNVRGNPASDTYGSGLYVGGSGTAEDCEIRGCLQGVCIDGGTLRNSLIAENDNNGSDKHAGGLWQAGGTVINCTCADNETTQENANGDFLATAGTTVNTIAIKATVSGGTRRNNCFNESVDFKRGYRLKGTAANKATCIDQGDNSVWDGVANPKDLLGNDRIFRADTDGVVDLGCFEYAPTGVTIFVR